MNTETRRECGCRKESQGQDIPSLAPATAPTAKLGGPRP
jgi:hypothetical protein